MDYDERMNTESGIRACANRITTHLDAANQEFKILKGLLAELPPPPKPRAWFWVRWYNWVALNLVNQLPLPR